MIKYLKNKLFRYCAVKAMKQAKRTHALTGETILVILWKGKPVAVSKRKLKEWIRTKRIRGITIQQIEKKALYITN